MIPKPIRLFSVGLGFWWVDGQQSLGFLINHKL
uniref:Uncharacterized protein n=1 Tax=Rhizophora mucronata TaxID=61149 RepID=A0A2P2MLY8_RHIMU